MFEFAQTSLGDKMGQMHTSIRRQEQRQRIRKSRNRLIVLDNQNKFMNELVNIPNDDQNLKEWFEQMVKMTSNIEDQLKLDNNTLNSLDTAVKKVRSDEAVELYLRVIALLSANSVSSLIGRGLLSFMKELLEHQSSLAIKTSVIQIAAAITLKGTEYCELVLRNDLLKISMRLAEEYPAQLFKPQGILFRCILDKSTTALSMGEIRQILQQHVKMLRSPHADMCDILQGISQFLLWRQPWIVNLLEQLNLIQMLLDMVHDLSLNPQQVCLVHKVVMFITNEQPNFFDRVKPQTEMLFDFLLSLIKNQSADLQKTRRGVYFCLSNIFVDCHSDLLELIIQKGIMDDLAKAVRFQRTNNLLECLLTVRSLLNRIDITMIDQQFIRCGLLQSILDQVELHLIHSENTLLVLVDVFSLMEESPAIVRIIDSRMVLKTLLHSETRAKIKDYWERLHNRTAEYQDSEGF